MYNYQYYNYGDRQFLFPFLVGAVTGGAAIGLTRPRPVFVNPPMQYQPAPPMGPGPFAYSNYGYYVPRPY